VYQKGNLGTAILGGLVSDRPPPSSSDDAPPDLPFTRFIATVRSEKSSKALRERFRLSLSKLEIKQDPGSNVDAAHASQAVILATDPGDMQALLTEPGFRDALAFADKLVISVAAGWTRTKLEQTLYGSTTTPANAGSRARIVRTLPNIAARTGQSLTAVETSDPAVPAQQLAVVDAIFTRVGKTVHIAPRLMDATTAVAGPRPPCSR